MSFELPDDLILFEGRRTRPPGVPTLSIQKRGVMSLTGPAVEALGNPAAVHLLYSPSARLIVLKPVVEGTPASFPVRRMGNNAKVWLISAKSFLDQNGVQYQDRVHSYTLLVKDGLGAVDLKAASDGDANGASGE